MKTISDHEAARAALLTQLRQRQSPQEAMKTASGAWRLEPGGPSRRHLAVATRQLAALIAADVPLTQALALTSAQAESRRLKAELEGVTARVQAGESFAQSLSACPDVFNRLFVNLVHVGEQAGLLAEALDRLATHLEQTDALRRKILNALMYPTIILLVAAGATLVLLLKVIPLFAEMFQQADVPLPLPTQLVIRASDTIRMYGIWLVVFTGCIALAFRSAVSHPHGRLLFDRIQLAIPLVGGVLHKGALARFTRSLATLLDGGVPLLQALIATRETLANRYLEQAISAACESLGQGQSLSVALTGAPGWPPLIPSLVGVGEETGRLASALAHLADYYTIETEYRVQLLTTVLEPLMIVLVAVLIGGLLVAMYLPVFNLNEVVS